MIVFVIWKGSEVNLEREEKKPEFLVEWPFLSNSRDGVCNVHRDFSQPIVLLG